MALNLGAFVTGAMYGSKMYATHRALFAVNVAFNAFNFVALISHDFGFATHA